MPKPPKEPGSPTPGDRLRDRLEAKAREKPVAPRARTWLWVAAFGTVIGIALLQLLGVLENPVASHIRRNLAEREAARGGAGGGDAAAAVVLDASVPLPEGLPSEYASRLREAVEGAADADPAVAAPAIRALPARAAEAPDGTRREVRAWCLRRVVPLVGTPSPRRAAALAAAAALVAADPLGDAKAAHEALVSGAVPALAAPDTDEETALAAVLLAAATLGPDRRAAADALRAAVLSSARPLAVRVGAAKALTASEVDDAVARLAADPGLDPALRAALAPKVPR